MANGRGDRTPAGVPTSSSYLVLEVPEDRLLTALAEEANLRDRDLDQIEAELDAEEDPARAAALALTLGRAARRSSGAAISRTADRHPEAARAIVLALDLLSLRPRRTERAERGYRFTAEDGHTIYVDDPLAAHWHAADRWGPPIRPDPAHPPLLAAPEIPLDALETAATEGRTLLVPFRPGRFEPVHPALRLLRAGFARSPDLDDLVRWCDIASLGVLEGPPHAIACEKKGGEYLPLGHHPAMGDDRLLELMGRLLMNARS